MQPPRCGRKRESGTAAATVTRESRAHQAEAFQNRAAEDE
jgi:hypothetical protein